MKVIVTLCFWIALLAWLVLGTAPAVLITGAAFILGSLVVAMRPLLRR